MNKRAEYREWAQKYDDPQDGHSERGDVFPQDYENEDVEFDPADK